MQNFGEKLCVCHFLFLILHRKLDEKVLMRRFWC
jgi:hypothetical protein